MIVYPAIDLMNGNVVRLRKGDFDVSTNYDLSPLSVAKSYADSGATWLHLVDLDGAKDPLSRQIALIAQIIDTSGLKVQTGGGIRSFDDVQALIDAGASRVVIGSLAATNPNLTKKIFHSFGGGSIVLAADVLTLSGSFQVAISGWQETSGICLSQFIESYIDEGLCHVLCTDIERDGTLDGCNTDLYQHISHLFPNLKLQASGGVANLNEIMNLDTDGVIIGKALYDRRFTLSEALKVAAC